MALNPKIIQPVQIIDGDGDAVRVSSTTGALLVETGTSGSVAGTPSSSGTVLGSAALESGGNLQLLVYLMQLLIVEVRISNALQAQAFDVYDDLEGIRSDIAFDLQERM